MSMRLLLVIVLALACSSGREVSRIEALRAAQQRGDKIAVSNYLAPGARIWFEKREGQGDPLTAAGGGRYAHWDEYFRSSSTASEWRVTDGAVSALIRETNDFYRLLDWTPKPYRMTWWLDREGRVTGALVQSLPGSSQSRMAEFTEWAKQHAPDELAYLMPAGRIDPTGDRAERFAALLERWRAAAGLPPVIR